ncbi:PREDICTED: stimulator of interferon genes protein-like [Priapulus caudatus]|uniref:Stimulator of interferon genes protein-like n=1 Tax=Priapulus caudatus TaxID=37621 RepID=A0ABM1EDH5_PRICU|nr:PREDICTED: stimulator of interferon genes protein-like [Priapulus caudatus]
MAKVSIGEGLAYNYYTGYLSMVLTSLAERITSSKFGKSTKNKKLILLIPANGEIPANLQEVDGNVRPVGKLDPLVIDRAGCKRKYSNNDDCV